MKEILVDEMGYKQFFEELEKLKDSLENSAIDGSEAYKDAVGDGWHDNFAFEEAKRKERNIASKMNSMLKEQCKLRIVDKVSVDGDTINIGDILRILVKYDINDVEEYTVKLTGKYLPNSKTRIQEISLNSPLGSALYLKKVTDKLSYEVNGNIIEIDVLELKKESS